MAQPADGKLAYRRILVKLSGEALMGGSDYGIDPAFLRRLATEIRSVQETGTEIGVVVGGGNLNISSGGSMRAGAMIIAIVQPIASALNSRLSPSATHGNQPAMKW